MLFNSGICRASCDYVNNVGLLGLEGVRSKDNDVWGPKCFLEVSCFAGVEAEARDFAFWEEIVENFNYFCGIFCLCWVVAREVIFVAHVEVCLSDQDDGEAWDGKGDW